MQWPEEYIRKDVCRLNQALTSTTSTQIESGEANDYGGEPGVV